MNKISKILFVILIISFIFPLACLNAVYAEPVLEIPTSRGIPAEEDPAPSEEPKKDPAEQRIDIVENPLLDESTNPYAGLQINSNDYHVWLYVGIGVGVVAVAVGTVFAVKATKRKKVWKI